MNKMAEINIIVLNALDAFKILDTVLSPNDKYLIYLNNIQKTIKLCLRIQRRFRKLNDKSVFDNKDNSYLIYKCYKSIRFILKIFLYI